ncbi:DUF5133 domain-containing protein [Streptomyces odonnellii]|uniref:DUF5133 domain-containing protein n=1 Tax=Streptomyces odonnellii TaxID=1417980 RepID=UPI000626AA80|nr:DUF5133 domain-containing protein [Streptomyces odonnellii]
MLMAHPAVLRGLIDQYETLSALHAETSGPEARRRMDDVSYTLCVSTGTRDIGAALAVARHQLPDAPTEDDTLVPL